MTPTSTSSAGSRAKPIYQIVAPRTVLYAVVIALVGAVMIYALATRAAEAVSVIHDRNPLYVRLADGSLRNAYAMRIVNKSLDSETSSVEVIGLPDAGDRTWSAARPLPAADPHRGRSRTSRAKCGFW